MFVRGKSANPNGRPKGARNKRNEELANLVSKLLQGMQRQVKRDIEALTPSERVKAFTALLPFAIPKQATISIEAKIKQEYEELKTLLIDAPSEAVEAIAKRVEQIKREREEHEQGKNNVTELLTTEILEEDE